MGNARFSRLCKLGNFLKINHTQKYYMSGHEVHMDAKGSRSGNGNRVETFKKVCLYLKNADSFIFFRLFWPANLLTSY